MRSSEARTTGASARHHCVSASGLPRSACLVQQLTLYRALLEMFALAVALAATPLVLAVYAYVGYPAIVWTLTRTRRNNVSLTNTTTWPTVTITVPVYNSVSSIRATLEGLIRLD